MCERIVKKCVENRKFCSVLHYTRLWFIAQMCFAKNSTFFCLIFVCEMLFPDFFPFINIECLVNNKYVHMLWKGLGKNIQISCTFIILNIFFSILERLFAFLLRTNIFYLIKVGFNVNVYYTFYHSKDCTLLAIFL